MLDWEDGICWGPSTLNRQDPVHLNPTSRSVPQLPEEGTALHKEQSQTTSHFPSLDRVMMPCANGRHGLRKSSPWEAGCSFSLRPASKTPFLGSHHYNAKEGESPKQPFPHNPQVSASPLWRCHAGRGRQGEERGAPGGSHARQQGPWTSRSSHAREVRARQGLTSWFLNPGCSEGLQNNFLLSLNCLPCS